MGKLDDRSLTFKAEVKDVSSLYFFTESFEFTENQILLRKKEVANIY